MRFSDLLSRADDELLQSFLGGHAVRLIMLLDPSSSTNHLRQLALELKNPQGLLLNPQNRAALFELLRPSEAGLLATLLQPSSPQDAYTFLGAFRCNRGSEKERMLFDFFELPTPLVEPKLVSPSIQVQDASYPLFAHQRRAARETTHYLNQEPHRVLLHMPTGSGKTRTAMNVIAEHLRAGEPRLVVWLAYSEELCEQATEEFAKAWNLLGNREISVNRFWGNHNPEIANIHDGFVVAGLAKTYRSLLSDSRSIAAFGGRCSLVVLDEAHQAIAETYRLVLDVLFGTGRQAALLGLTATPGRTWADMAEDEKLANFFARKKVMLTVPGYANPIEYLTVEQYLAKTDFRSLNYDGGNTLSDADLLSIQRELEIPARVLEKLAEDDQRNLRIVVELAKMIHHHKRILVFAASVSHSDILATVLRARGIDASSLTGSTPGVERSRIIEEFKSDQEQSKVLVNYGILTTGFDAPKTSAVLIARPTKSLVLYSQMVGRAIRGVRAGGNLDAEIVTVVDQNLPGFGSVAQAFENWEDVWKSQTTSSMI